VLLAQRPSGATANSVGSAIDSRRAFIPSSSPFVTITAPIADS
jgi:hypothetical protein